METGLEAPTPFQRENINNSQNNEIEDVSFSQSSDFKFLYQDKNFIITIGIIPEKQYIYFRAKQEEILTYLYERKMNLGELMDFDRLFKSSEDIEQAYNEILSIFQNKDNSIKEIINNKLILLINISYLGNSRVNNLELIKKSQNKDLLIENLAQQITELKTNNTNLQNELNEFKKKFEKFEELLNNHEFILNIIDSKIIKDKKEYDFLVERLKNVKLPESKDIIEGENNKIVFVLLYRGSRDRDGANDFHLKCDKYKNTLILVKTKKGLRFGGFTCEKWDGKGDKRDKNAFCFSLTKNKIYNWIKGKSIYADPESGPFFGNCMFEIKDKFFDNGGECSEDYFYDNQEGGCELNNGEEVFEVEEVEVFNISF